MMMMRLAFRPHSKMPCRFLATVGFALLASGLAAPGFGQGSDPGQTGADGAPAHALPQQTIAAGDEIVVSTGAAPALVRNRLEYEIDNVDVSAFAERAEGATTLNLPTELAPGAHVLRVTEVLPDGRVLERGRFDLEVRGALLEQASLIGSLNVEITRRMADTQLFDPPERVQLRGAANLRGRASGQDWDVSATLPVLFDEHAGAVSSGTLERRDWDLGAFLLEGRRGPVSGRVGHSPPGPPPPTPEAPGPARRG